MKIPFTWIAITILMVAFVGCKPIETIREVKGETKIEYRDKLRIDSVMNTIKDSIYINGDTVKIFRDRWKTKVEVKTDTVFKTRDVERFKDVVKIKPISFFSWIKIFMYGAIFGAFVLIVAKYWRKIASLFKF